jgi:hypothetical protein
VTRRPGTPGDADGSTGSGANGSSPHGGQRNVIPLPLITSGRPDPTSASPARREAIRAAVVQVITDLVVRRVPPAERLPHYQTAADLLEGAGRSLTELLEAAEPGPAQDALFELLEI